MSVKTVPGALDILNQKLGGNAGDIPASSTKEYALEKIYKTLGGEESLDGVNTTSEIIEKIAGVAQGGGGSSDFSTAEMLTHITVTGEVPPFAVAMLHGFMIDDNGWLDVVEFTTSENRTVKVPLYHQINDTIFTAPSSTVVKTFTAEKVSGDVTITQDEDGYAITVEGDCEININVVIRSV